MTQHGFYVNMNECTGCRCCQVACKEKHNLPIGALCRRVLDFEGGTFPDVWAASFSKGCNHCDDPVCLKNCPAAAYIKEEEYGFVLQDTTRCIGCKRCTQVCPYGVPIYISQTDTVRKCDACFDWVSNGLRPACVAACSTRCLQFGPIEDLMAEHASETLYKDSVFLPDSSITNPNVLINLKSPLIKN